MRDWRDSLRWGVKSLKGKKENALLKCRHRAAWIMNDWKSGVEMDTNAYWASRFGGMGEAEIALTMVFVTKMVDSPTWFMVGMIEIVLEAK